MKPIEKYLSIDRMIFDNVMDCVEHENCIIEDHVIILNYYNEKISFSMLEDAWAVKILDERGLNLFQNNDDYEEEFTQIGTYIWDEFKSCFICIEDTLQAFKKLE